MSEQVPAGVAGASGADGRRGQAGLRLAVGGDLRRLGKLGIGSAETLRTWVRRDEVDTGRRPGVTSEQSEELKRLKRENAELEVVPVLVELEVAVPRLMPASR